MNLLSRRYLLAATAAAAFAACGAAQAQSGAPIRLLVGYSAGGPVDQGARLFALALSKELGNPVVVENKTGANATLAGSEVARAKPDGLTLWYAASPTITISPNVMTKMQFDPVKDLTPIAPVLSYYNVLVVNNDQPYKNTQELVAAAKAAPGKLNYASAGVGGSNHLGALLFAKRSGIELNHVPYKGEAPMVQDLLANQVQIGYGSVAVQKQHIELGKLRAVGTVTPHRLEAMPDLPTLQEQGFPDEAFRMPSWFAIIAPKGVPKPLQDRLARELSKVMAMPDVKESITKMGYAAVSDSSPDKLMAEYREWAPKWKNLAELSGAKIDQ